MNERERVQKPKFKPVVTRVKLNPEQAVLQCNCYATGQVGVFGGGSVQLDPDIGGPFVACNPVGKTLLKNFGSPGNDTWAPSTASS